MHFLVSYIPLWFAFATYVFAANTPLLVPSQDNFYRSPSNLSAYAVGDVIRSRPAPALLKSTIFPVNVKSATQILVRSNDAKGDPTSAVSVVIEPYNGDPKKLLSYQIAQDSSLIDCAPSYAIDFGASLLTFTSLAEMFLIQLALDEGWYVVTTDHQAQNAAFGVGRQSGQVVLDGIRATLRHSNDFGLDSKPQVAFWGYSGGALAAGWAAALQPAYAPELKELLIGAALGGLPSNLTDIAQSVEGSIFLGLTAVAIAGITNQYPEVKDYVDDQLYPLRKSAFSHAYKLCLAPAIVYYNIKHFFSGPDKWFKSGWEVLNYPPVQEIFKLNTLGVNATETPEIPILVYHGILDEIVPIRSSRRVFDTWCANGIESFEYSEDKTAEHIIEIVSGSMAGFKWLKDRYSGVEPVKGCSHTVRTTNLEYPGTLPGWLEFLATAVKAVLFVGLGPDGKKLNNSNFGGDLFSAFTNPFSGFKDLGPLISAVAFKKDQASMDALDARVKQFVASKS